jgi:SHS family lactate transporter-like MFS transporter
MVLRALFGIGMGGEWGVGASLVMEKVPRKWRGALSGFLQEGYSAGYLLAAVASYYLLDTFGWRRMFFLGGIPALLVLFIRFGIKESEVWKKYKAPNWSHLTKSILRHWKLWLYLTALMAMMNFASHGTQDLFPTFLNKYHKMSTHDSSKVLVIMNVGSILGGIAFGMASDRVGRRIMMILAFVGALLILHLWAFSESMQNIILGAFLLQFMIQGAWGIIPAHINELSPNQVRGFLPGFAYQCGNLVAASIARLQSTLVVNHPFPNVLFMTAGCIFIVAIVVIAAGVERRGVEFAEA